MVRHLGEQQKNNEEKKKKKNRKGGNKQSKGMENRKVGYLFCA